TIAVVGFTGVWVVALLAMIAVGASQGMFMTLSMTMVQESVPDALRGRVTGLFMMSAGGIMSFANLGHGYLADRVGALPVLALPAVSFVISVALMSVMYPRLRRV